MGLSSTIGVAVSNFHISCILCDNLKTIYIAFDPVFHACTKHIELDYPFIWERILNGTHQVQFILSIDQLADVFMKGLHKSRFHLLRPNFVFSR